MMLALHFLIDALRASPLPAKKLVGAFCLAGCTVLSHLTLLSFYLAAGAAFFCIALRSRKQRSDTAVRAGIRRGIAGALIVTIALFAAVIPIVLKLRRLGQFYFGGTQGFFHDTVMSLVRSSLYEASLPPFALLIIADYAVIAFVLAVMVLFYSELKIRNSELPGAIAGLVTLFAALGIIAQHSLFGTKFVVERAALFFILLVIFTWGAAADALIASLRAFRGLRLSAFSLFGCFVAALVIHTITQAKFTHTATWKYDAETNKMLQDLAALPIVSQTAQRKLGITWLLEPGINYYIYTRKLTWLARVHRRGVNSEDFDYYYYLPEDEAALHAKRVDIINR